MNRPIPHDLVHAIEDATSFLQSIWGALQSESRDASDPAIRTRMAFTSVSACLGAALGCRLLGSPRCLRIHEPTPDVTQDAQRVLDQLTRHLHDVTDSQLLQFHAYVEDVAEQVSRHE